MTEPIALHELIEPGAATRRLRAGSLAITNAEPTYVRHKPGETTIVAYRFVVPEGGDTRGYVQWCADPGRAAEIHAKAVSLRPRASAIGVGVARLDSHTILYAFPNDARLRRLRWYTDPRKAKRSLEPVVASGERISGHRTTVGVLRYKPERRLVAKIDLATKDGRFHPLLVRYGTQRHAHRLAKIATHLRSRGVNTPAPIAQLDDGRVGVDQFIEGRQLREIVQIDGAGGTDLADALRRFHAAPSPGAIAGRTAVSDLRQARRGLAGLGAWEPALEEAANSLAELLTRTLPSNSETPVLIHGDLHGKNILVDLGLIAFVDLERVAVGSAAIDLGYFRAHAIALAIRQPGWSPTALDHAEAMIDQYRRIAGPVGHHDLAWNTSIGLVDQALLVTRHLEARWQTTSAQLLDAARRQLEHRSSTLSGLPG